MPDASDDRDASDNRAAPDIRDAKKTAVILFNLGGPDSPEAVEPFLFNLFSDRAIIRLPNPLRYLMAKIISKRRSPVAREIYNHLGGASPLLKETERQAAALESALAAAGEFKCFIAMRYWHPFADATAADVKAYGPDAIILLPLYPQFSTTTTASSLADWHQAAQKAALDAPTSAICCYPDNDDFIAAHVEAIRREMEVMPANEPLRILFSAHGLPEKISDDGDPYKDQVGVTLAAITKELWGSDVDHQLCFQSRVGPLKWIGPSTDDAITQAASDGVNLMVVPIAFVSEHSETLVELDIEYRLLATSLGIRHFHRVPALSVSSGFIRALKGLVLGVAKRHVGEPENGCIRGGVYKCGADGNRCPQKPNIP